MNQFRPAFILVIAIIASSTQVVAEDKRFPTKFDWGKLVVTDSSVELHVTAIPDSGTIAVPRFNNPYSRVYWKSAPEQKLKFVPEVTEWVVTLPESTPNNAVVVIETVGNPQLLTKPYVNRINESGAYVLPAHHAVVHGEKLRYEPQPHKNTVGYWTIESDWCEWKIDIDRPGKFAVHILQGCGKGQGGSVVEVRIGDNRLEFDVEDTGHFQNFKDRMVGTLAIQQAGEQSLQIRPIRKASKAVMDVRQVRLIPVK